MEKSKRGSRVQDIENNMPPKNVAGLEAISTYNKYVMRHLRELVDFYADEKYRYARFERHIGKKRTISLEVDGLSRCKCGENHIVVTKKERKQINLVAEALEKTSKDRTHLIPASIE